MKRLIYQVSVGKPSNLYKWCIDSVSDYCLRHDIHHKVQTEPILKIAPLDWKKSNRSENVRKFGYLPIYEKENAFSYFDQYDQIAIIDSDIFIQPQSPNIFEELNDDTDFAGVVEREMPITAEYARKIIAYSHGQYASLKNVDFKPNQLVKVQHYSGNGLIGLIVSDFEYFNSRVEKNCFFVLINNSVKQIDGKYLREI